MKIALSKRACGALPLALVLVAGACAEDPATDADLGAPIDLIATGADLLDHGWERAPVAAATAAQAPDPTAARALDIDLLATRAAADPAWHGRDGRRYEVLFVAEDGTTYGRANDARAMPLPSTATGFGADDAGARHGREDFFTILGGTLASDRRTRLGSTVTLESYPVRTIGSLNGDGGTTAGGCTGTMVGPRHVITAAHCVMGSNGVVTTSGFFNPGQTNTTLNNGGNARRWSGVALRDWRVHTKYDYALLYLENRADNASLGWMGITWWGTSGYTGKAAYNKGYPCGPNNSCGTVAAQQCLASPRADKRCDGWMYADADSLHAGAATSDDRLEYDIDTSDGHSGSAIYTYVDDVPAIMAIHHGPSGSYNHGARFRTSMWNDICTWIADVPSSYGTHSLCH